MKTKNKSKVCRDKDCGTLFTPFNSLQKYCSYHCAKKNEKPKKRVLRKRMRPFSVKREAEMKQYRKDRIEFLNRPQNMICPVTGERTTEVHHKKGRIGSLLLDQRFWLGVSSDGHKWIEANPEKAKELGYSLDRHAKAS